MPRQLSSFTDILEPRRQEYFNFMWVSRKLNTVVANKQTVELTPAQHKQETLNSPKMQEIIKRYCEENNISKEECEKQVREILDEIGFNKNLRVVRWLGLVLTKFVLRVSSRIFVNDDSMQRLKSRMGNTPMLFLPSHRSYADFILMHYLCFHYDIKLPTIAAGMDFYSMWAMGSALRDVGAFYMRRSINDDSLYWNTFRQYVNQLVTKSDVPIKFFIEGTRSRSCKSLVPKFGLLSMALKPFFTAAVPDILIVPVNVSYDRVMEEKLFAYELLGVPKPKESTSAFFKSLSILKENYGDMYVDFGEPFSVKKFFGDKADRSIHSLRPIHLQDLTQNEKELTADLAYTVLHLQQKLCTISVFNVMAAILTNNLVMKRKPFKVRELTREVRWFNSVLETFGAFTNLGHYNNELWDIFNIHKNLIFVDNTLNVHLTTTPIVLNNIDPTRLKGHTFSQDTVTVSVPLIMLQLYVHPMMHYLISPAILITILRQCKEHTPTKDEIFDRYNFLRSVFFHEFVTHEKWAKMDFEESLRHLESLEALSSNLDSYCLGPNKKLEEMLYNMLQPFFFAYYVEGQVLSKLAVIPQKESYILKASQAELEKYISKNDMFVHPYVLSLDTLSNCLQSLLIMNAVNRFKTNGDILYEANPVALCSIISKLGTYVHYDVVRVELMSNTQVHCSSKL